jgi:hypothetical protein
VFKTIGIGCGHRILYFILHASVQTVANCCRDSNKFEILLAVVSTGRRNTLIFRKRWSVLNEVSPQDLLFS